MNANLLLAALGDVDEDLIAAALENPAPVRTVQPTRRVWWAALAACVCLAIAAGVFFAQRHTTQAGLDPSGGILPDYYFRDNAAGNGASAAADAWYEFQPPYTETRVFSDQREALEAEGILPALPDHPLFQAEVHYLEGGSVYSVSFTWSRRGKTLKEYSTLTVTAGPDKVELPPSDVFVYPAPTATETQRDGVTVTAVGVEDQNKTLTWQTEDGWYQVEGSWNDSYGDVVALLDWFWDHPLDFDRFPTENGDLFETFYGLDSLSPEVLAYLPDLSALGYGLDSLAGYTKNGGFYSCEAAYSRADGPHIWWLIQTQPDAYDDQAILGDLSDLTFDQVARAIADTATQRLVFRWDGYTIILSYGSQATAEDLWAILQTIL